MKFTLPSAAIAWSALLLSNLSVATPVSFSSGYQLESLGYFTGTLDYNASSDTAASLTLVLNNLSSTAAGGSITGVALNVPTLSGTSISALSLTSSNANFQSLGLTSDGINSSPLGMFDFGAGTKAPGPAPISWQGGFPNNGIAVNNSATFTFNFTGTNLASLSTQAFIDAIAPGNTQGPSEFIAVRFAGFSGDNAGKSDKVGGIVPNAPPVPVPASVWLMLSGLGGLGFMSRKRKSAM